MKTESPKPSSKLTRGLPALGLLLGGLFLARVLIAQLRVPDQAAFVLSLIVSALFLAVPVLVLFFVADDEWPWTRGLGLLLLGVAMQVGFTLLFRANPQSGLTSTVLQALAQTGLLTWCTGLGALLGAGIRDRNLFLPVAIFLAGLDVFLVTYPAAPTRAILENRPEIFQSVAVSIPKVQSVAEAGSAVPINAYVGPADFLFLFFFFVALHKFRLRRAATLRWTIVALVAYLFVVLLFGGYKLGPVSLGALPALVPIGGVFLAVNFREFQMKPDEKIATWVIAVIALGLAAFGISQADKPRASRPVPANSGSAPAAPGSLGSPAPTAPDRSPSPIPSAP